MAKLTVWQCLQTLSSSGGDDGGGGGATAGYR